MTADLSLLNGRQLEVTRLRQQGRSMIEIGKQLRLPASTVSVYCNHARATLRVKAWRSRQLRELAKRRADDDPANDTLSDPVLQKAKAVAAKRGTVRSVTLGGPRLTRAEKRSAQLVAYPEEVERPRTRADCVDGPRPCPFVSCAHHLYLDVNDENGSIKLNFPHLEVWEMADSCGLDVADKGGATLDEVGIAINVTRERVRQIEVVAGMKIRKSRRDLGR